MKFAISYAGFVLATGTLLLAVVWVFLLRYVPDAPRFPVNDGSIILTGPSRDDLLEAFVPKAAAAWAFLLVVGVAGGWLLAGRMLAPLARITDAARQASGGSLSHRIRMPGPQDELRELADQFDTMLEQLEAHLAEQQRFAANASHELRTPLAISQTLLDVAAKDPGRDHAELIERLRLVNTRAIDLTESLLVLSRADSRSFTKEAVDLSLVAEEAVEALLPLAEQRGITLDVTGEPTATPGNAALLLRVATNLVQNAIVHNVDGGTVTVWTGEDAGGSLLRVENTGPVLTPGIVSTLTEPFQRATSRARTDEHAGVGLGLAIVQSVVQAHDGTLDLAPGDEGGLTVTVRLPGGVSPGG
jgi:two-component system sensor histidine kinase VanS